MRARIEKRRRDLAVPAPLLALAGGQGGPVQIVQAEHLDGGVEVVGAGEDLPDEMGVAREEHGAGGGAEEEGVAAHLREGGVAGLPDAEDACPSGEGRKG